MLITILRHIIIHFRPGLWQLELIFSIMWSHIENMIDIAYCICNTKRLRPSGELEWHYDDITMSLMTSQITSLTIVYSTVYADTDLRKHQSSASLAFVRGIHRGPVNSPHKLPVTPKMFPFDDVIMISWVTEFGVQNLDKIVVPLSYLGGISFSVVLCIWLILEVTIMRV